MILVSGADVMEPRTATAQKEALCWIDFDQQLAGVGSPERTLTFYAPAKCISAARRPCSLDTNQLRKHLDEE
jgi:hypothetical protein